MWVQIGMIALWGAVVWVHRMLWPEPRALWIAHLIVFVLSAGFLLVGLLFTRFMVRRAPGILGDERRLA